MPKRPIHRVKKKEIGSISWKLHRVVETSTIALAAGGIVLGIVDSKQGPLVPFFDCLVLWN